jgi:hypothetical protein
MSGNTATPGVAIAVGVTIQLPGGVDLDVGVTRVGEALRVRYVVGLICPLYPK